jgi:glycerophosphoryl diester phosphodiesterase
MKKIFLAALAAAAIIAVSAQQYKAPQIIANGGFHKHGSSGAKNSMSALKAAQKLKVYGSECDVNLTKDGGALVVASGWHPGSKAKPRADVQRSTEEKMLSIPFSNGEYISTLEDFVKRAKKKPATKLILEAKPQATIQRETELVELMLATVDNEGMNENVEYISFSPWICFELAKKAPKGTKIMYLSGNYDPLYVKGMGCSGIDYNIKVLKKKKAMIKQAQKLGLTVNVWTVNKEEDIRWCIQNGVDFITTDEPILAKKIVKEMCGKQK